MDIFTQENNQNTRKIKVEGKIIVLDALVTYHLSVISEHHQS